MFCALLCASIGLALPVAFAASASPTLLATFTRTSDWGTGYVGSYTITNSTTASRIDGWNLSFSIGPSATLVNGWNGTFTQVGSTVTTVNASWNGTIAPGGSATFGFQVAYTGSYVAPDQCTVLGASCSGTPVPVTTQPPPTSGVTPVTSAPAPVPTSIATTTPAPPTATFAETSDWGTGFTADFTLANPGSPPVTGWTLQFVLPTGATVTDAWNGELAGTGNGYRITNASWNATLAPGGTVTVGVEGSRGALAPTPVQCTINGAACTGGGGSAGPPVVPTTTTSSPTPTMPPPTTQPGAVPPASGPSAGGGASGVFAPYVDTTLDPPSEVVSAATAAPGHFVTLGFVVAGSGCQASWGGYYDVSSRYLTPEIGLIRSMGGDVIASFGGAAGTDLAQACTSVSQLEAQYASVVSTYSLTKIDFDVEGSSEADVAGLARRFQAVAALQQSLATRGIALSVYLTVPVLPSGLDPNGLEVVKAALANGVSVSVVNIMAMDYGDWAAPSPSGAMGTYAIDAAQATHAQLVDEIPLLTSAQAWSMIGVTPMIGVNDVNNEVFGLADASQLAAFASQQRLGRISMWSSNRDTLCPPGTGNYASPSCSGVVQAAGQFATLLGSSR